MQLNFTNASIDHIETRETHDIILPSESSIDHVSMDIGGTLCKIVCYTKGSVGGRINFYKFETHKIMDAIIFIKTLPNISYITATGGGSLKYSSLITAELPGIPFYKEDEMKCLIIGLNFLIKQIPDEVFTYDEKKVDPMTFVPHIKNPQYPFLLVNVGSGVSIIKIIDEFHYERVSGTSLGGGTLCGLLSLLTDASSYDEMLDLSKDGDNKNVDLSVGDIYGGDYEKVGLKASTIASSFGGIYKIDPDERKNVKKEDISRSLLFLVSNNIGQIAYLNAQIHKCKRVFFSGFFIRGHPITMNTLSYSINFWSKGNIAAHFLRHEGYIGSMGAFLSRIPHSSQLPPFMLEDFSHADKIGSESLTAFGSLIASETLIAPFPALLDETYIPDTLTLHDTASRLYWIDLIEKSIPLFSRLATSSGGGDVESFQTLLTRNLQMLRENPLSYGQICVSGLLMLREQCLREAGFFDVFKSIKDSENDFAISCLDGFLKRVDAVFLDSEKDCVNLLLDNVLAGNMYDWGSQAIISLLNDDKLDFEGMKSKVSHPERFNNWEQFADRVIAGPAYHKCVIFVDNSGSDVVLGIIPFVRYLVSKGSVAVLAANSVPSLNDVTAPELRVILDRISEIDTTIDEAWNTTNLIRVFESASASPCIDLSRITLGLAKECEDADLIVIEGMGRSIHTNLFAKFRIDCLRLAVFKNSFTAHKLDAQMLDAICLFHEAVKLE